MVFRNMEIDCWRKRYKNTDETTCKFIVKNILSHVFSFFTLSINKSKEIQFIQIRGQRQEGTRSETGNPSFICFCIHLDHHFLELKTKVSKSTILMRSTHFHSTYFIVQDWKWPHRGVKLWVLFNSIRCLRLCWQFCLSQYRKLVWTDRQATYLKGDKEI